MFFFAIQLVSSVGNDKIFRGVVCLLLLSDSILVGSYPIKLVLSGVEVKVLDCELEVCEFEL